MFTRQICLFLIFFSLASMSQLNANAQKTDDNVQKTSKYKGLQIARTDLLNSLTDADSLLHFKPVPNTKGAPKFTAKGSFGSRVEITGTEDNVTMAQWTVSQPANGNLSRLAFTRMAFFVDLLAKQEGTTWFFQQTFLYNQSPANPISSSNTVNGTKAMFTYDPVKKTFIITISPE